MTNEEIQKEVAQLQDVKNWPLWPVLPLKRVVNGSGGPELGLLYSGSGEAEPVVYLGLDLFDFAEASLTPSGKEGPFQALEYSAKLKERRAGEPTIYSRLQQAGKKVYPTLEAMVEDGWIRD